MTKNILLVDDESVFHFITERIIKSTGVECNIQKASSGREALAIVNGYLNKNIAVPEYIFLDLNMPVMDGFQFIQVFQKIEFHNRPNTTIVILTSSVDEKDKERAKSLGIQHYVSKPLNEKDLQGILNF